MNNNLLISLGMLEFVLRLLALLTLILSIIGWVYFIFFGDVDDIMKPILWNKISE